MIQIDYFQILALLSVLTINKLPSCIALFKVDIHDYKGHIEIQLKTKRLLKSKTYMLLQVISMSIKI